MARKENAIFVNMCMVTNGCKVLVIDRKKEDWPGITFPGGHIEKNESFVDSVIREVCEETGLTIKPKFRGIVTFVMEELGTEYMHLFTATGWEGEAHPCDEGELAWIRKKDLLALPLWEGDKIFLRLLEEDAPFFSLKLQYVGEKLTLAMLDGKRIV